MCSLDWLALGQLKFYRGVSTEDTTSRNLQLTLKGHPCTPYIGYADHEQDRVHDVVNGRIGNMCYMLMEGRGAGSGRERGELFTKLRAPCARSRVTNCLRGRGRFPIS